MEVVKRQWQQNGTKILGYIGMAFGALSVLDTATIDVTAKTLGPKWGPIFKALCVFSGAVAVAMRGHRNTSDIAAQIVSQASTGEVVASAQTVTAVAKTAVASETQSTPPEKP